MGGGPVVAEGKELTIVSEFGFKPKYGLKEGLRELIEWYQNGRP